MNEISELTQVIRDIDEREQAEAKRCREILLDTFAWEDEMNRKMDKIFLPLVAILPTLVAFLCYYFR